MKKYFVRLLKNNFISLMCFIILGILYMYHLNQHKLIYHLGDEWGYWANAAYFNGYDWSGIAQHNGYYSFGYSIILAPLFLIKNFEIRYSVALLINVFLQFLSFILLKNIGEYLFPILHKKYILIISLCVTLYVGNVFFSKTTLCECMLYFIFVCITYLILQIVRLDKWKHYILLGIFTAYIFMVHMRALGIVLAVLLFLTVKFFIDTSDRKKIIISVLEIVFLFVLAILIKQILIDKLYSSSDYSKGNDFSGQVSNLQLLMSFHGINLMIRSLVGKMYYLLSSSFLIIVWAFVWIWQEEKTFAKCINAGHSDDDNAPIKLAFFLLFAFIFTVGISSLATIGESQRLDVLIYGRYNEYIIEPFLLIGSCYLLANKNSIAKKWMISVFVYFLCAIYITKEFNQVENPQIIETMIVGVTYLSYNGQNVLYDVWNSVIALKVVLISTFIMIFLRFRKVQIRVLGIMIMAVIWFCGGNWLLDRQLYIMNNYYTCKNIADYLTDNDIYEIVYLTNEKYDFFDYYRADILQYMIPNLDIDCQNVNDLIDDNEYVFLIRTGLFEEGYFNKYKCVATSNDFELYVK